MFRSWTPRGFRLSLTSSVARTILLSVGAAVVLMFAILASRDAYQARRGLEAMSEERGVAALDMLAAVHTQAMKHRKGVQDRDPAIQTLDGAMGQFSHQSQGVKLWVAMGPKVADFQRRAHSDELELAQDALDRRTLETGLAQRQVQGDQMRLTRPVVMGQGAATLQDCGGCHTAQMGVQPGEVIGLYSAEVNMGPDIASWRGHFIQQTFAALLALGAAMGLLWAMIYYAFLRPLARLNQATSALGRGDLGENIGDTERRDELGGLARALSAFQDELRERQALEARNAHLARHDALTGLPNRTAFNEHLEDAIDRARRTQGTVAVVGIDLNRFKAINDRHGHAMGDEVLIAVSRRLADLTEFDEAVARFGGDEFAAFKLYKTREDLQAFLDRLQASIAEPIQCEGLELSVGASIGVAIFPDDGDRREMVMNNADLAMYRAKSTRKDVACFYVPNMDETVRERRALAADLRRAMEQDQLAVHYQVQKSVESGAPTGYEALLRWTHPTRGIIPPSQFIAVAEESGLISELGDWVLERACREAAGWPDDLKVAVNIAPLQLANPELPKRVQEILMATGLSPRRLELEIPEATIIADKGHALHMLRRLKAIGVAVAIEDFGTGYSSLDMLNAFPFDKIKIDGAFLVDADRRPQSMTVIRAILALGRNLRVPVLAEGVETESQLALLQAEGCEQAQGYLLGRPGPRDTGEEPVRQAG